MTNFDTTAKPIKVWRRIHRPEEYAADAAKFIASELKLPNFLMAPFIPLAARFLKSWEDAAVETTAIYEMSDSTRIMRTFFHITDYSNAAFYSLAEKILKKLGVGADLSTKYGDTDFAWILLGGVLNEYASYAGISPATSEKLIAFRMPLSDYFTATTWFPDRVEIANMTSGRVESMKVPPSDINKIVDWTISFEKKLCGAKSVHIQPGSPLYDEYLLLEKTYGTINSR